MGQLQYGRVVRYNSKTASRVRHKWKSKGTPTERYSQPYHAIKGYLLSASQCWPGEHKRGTQPELYRRCTCSGRCVRVQAKQLLAAFGFLCPSLCQPTTLQQQHLATSYDGKEVFIYKSTSAGCSALELSMFPQGGSHKE